MTGTVDLSVVFPAYNEEGRLEQTLLDALMYFSAGPRTVELIVVDDGSRDGTSQLVMDLARRYANLRLIRLPTNRGKGYAVRLGVVNARGNQILFADSDGATPIEEIERLSASLAGGADIAIGSRAIRSDSVSVRAKFYRRIMGRAFHYLVETLAVRGIKDTQCGFKLFTASAAHDIFPRIRMDGFSFDVELLLLARRRGLRVDEIPVNWEHKPGSRVSLVVDSAKMAMDLFRMRSNIMRGHYNIPALPQVSFDGSQTETANAATGRGNLPVW